MRALFLIAFFVLGTPAAAETRSNKLTAQAKQPADTSGLIGFLQVRPSQDGGKDFFYTFNIAELGYRVNPNLSFSYQQQFFTNINDPSKTSLAPSLYDGFVRAQANGIWSVPKYYLRLDYEPRVYLPTDPEKQAHGMFGLTRQYLKLGRKLGENFAMNFWEVPILHGYTSNGYADATGSHANPVFENRFFLMPEIMFLKGKIDITLPLIWGATRYRAFSEEVENDNAWGHKLWVNPEIVFMITPNFGLGLAYESQNLMSADFSEFKFSEGFSTGTSSLILHIGL